MIHESSMEFPSHTRRGGGGSGLKAADYLAFSSKKLTPLPHNRHGHALGSVLIEAVVMMGLIGALTPVLYTHVADRKEEMQNINKANTLMQLQRETESFLKDDASRNSITFSNNKATLTPSQIGLSSALNNKYTIGLKKDGDKITAIIAEKEGSGNDVKAAKVANLIGVSAGIKSAMDASNAYGVNGLWKETLANYGLNSVPAGSTVVTTEYNKERNSYYSSEMIVDSDIDAGDYKVAANQICIGNDCISGWSEVSSAEASDFEVLASCIKDINGGAAGSSSANCTKALSKGLLTNCSTIASTYKAAGLRAPSGYYYLGSGYAQKVCYFVDGAVPTSAKQIIDGCNDATSDYRKFACMYDRQASGFGAYSGGSYTASCSSIIAANSSYATGYYTLTTNSTGTSYAPFTPCVFNGSSVANDTTAISQCNNGSDAACVWAAMNNKNKSCSQIGTATSSTPGYYRIVSSYTLGEHGYNVVASEQGCYFASNTASAVISACDSAGASYATTPACAYAFQNGWNTSCESIRAAGATINASTSHRIMVDVRVSGGTGTCCYGDGETPPTAATQCCSGMLIGGKCSGGCKKNGESASAASECCSNYLSGGVCTAVATCKKNGETASANSECCSNYRSGTTCADPTTSCTCLGTDTVCASATSKKTCNGCTYGSTTNCSSGQYCLGGVCTTITATATKSCPSGFTQKTYSCGGYTEKWCVSNSTMEVTKAYAACQSAGLGMMTDVVATTGCGVGVNDTTTRVYTLVGTSKPVWISTVGLTRGVPNGLYAYSLGYGYGTSSYEYARYNPHMGYYSVDGSISGIYSYLAGYRISSSKYTSYDTSDSSYRTYHYAINNYPNDGTRANAGRAAYAIYTGSCSVSPTSTSIGQYCNPPTRAVLCYHGVSSCSVSPTSTSIGQYCNPVCPTAGYAVCGPL